MKSKLPIWILIEDLDFDQAYKSSYNIYLLFVQGANTMHAKYIALQTARTIKVSMKINVIYD